MALLSRQERTTLEPDERRALRKSRRLDKRTDRDERRYPRLLERAEELMLDLKGDDVPGLDKFDEVLDDLAEELDDLLTFDELKASGAVGAALATALEALDGVLIRAILGLMVRRPLRRLADRLRAEGRI